MRLLPLLGSTFSSMPLWLVDIALHPSYHLKYKKTYLTRGFGLLVSVCPSADAERKREKSIVFVSSHIYISIFIVLLFALLALYTFACEYLI